LFTYQNIFTTIFQHSTPNRTIIYGKMNGNGMCTKLGYWSIYLNN